MWIKYVGHPDGADVPNPDSPLGGEVFCPYDTPVDLPAQLAKRLLEQPDNWKQAQAPSKAAAEAKASK